MNKVSMIIDKNDLQKKTREELFEVFCQCLDEISASTTEAIEIDFTPLGAIKKFYRPREVAEAFQVSDRMVRKWCEAGKIVAPPYPRWRMANPCVPICRLGKGKRISEYGRKNQREV